MAQSDKTSTSEHYQRGEDFCPYPTPVDAQHNTNDSRKHLAQKDRELASEHCQEEYSKSFRSQQQCEELATIRKRQKSRLEPPKPITDNVYKKACYDVDHVILFPKHRNCIGPAVLVHNQGVPPGVELEYLHRMEEGAAQMKDELTKLGFAVIWLKNPKSEYVRAVLKYLSSDEAKSKYPESFSFFMFYVMGHGCNRTFYTCDGSVGRDSVTKLAKELNAHFELFVFMFDSCRSVPGHDMGGYPDGYTGDGQPGHPEASMESHTVILYGESGGRMLHGPGNGLSFMAHTVIELIGTHITLSDLGIELRKRFSEHKFPFHTTSCSKIVLCDERNKRMLPQLVEVIVSNDGTSADVKIHSPPPVNPDLFPDKGYLVKISFDRDSWTELAVVREMTTDPVPDPQEQQATSPPESSLSLGDNVTVTLTAVLPIEGRSQPTTAYFQAITKKSCDLELPSDIIEKELPCIDTPQITKKTLHLKDCQQPEVETEWTTNQCFLKISNFHIHIYKNGVLVHSEPIRCSENKTSHRHNFAVPALCTHKPVDQYAVVIEAEREWDQKRVASLQVPMELNTVTPHLEASFSEDGATITAYISFEQPSQLDSSFPKEPEYQLQMFDDSEWQTLDWIPQASTNRVQDSTEAAGAHLQNPVAQPSTVVALSDRLSLTRVLPLTEGRRDSQNALVRVISTKPNTVNLPSNELSLLMPPLAIEPISGQANVKFENNKDPEISVQATFQQPWFDGVPQNKVHIYKNDADEPIYTTPATSLTWSSLVQNHYECRFAVPDLGQHEDGDTYKMTIEAERASEETIKSADIELVVKKGCCYGFHCTRKMVCAAVFVCAVVVLFVLGVTFIADFTKANALVGSYLPMVVPWVPSVPFDVLTDAQKFIQDLPVFPRLLLVSDMSQVVVVNNMTADDQLNVFCAKYNKDFLRNHENHKFSMTSQHGKIRVNNDTQTLPIGNGPDYAESWYTLPSSAFSVNLTLLPNGQNSSPNVEILLYQQVGNNPVSLSDNPVIGREKVDFFGMTSNTTVIQQSIGGARSFLAVSTPDNVTFNVVVAVAKRFYYDNVSLNIVNDSDLIKPGSNKTIPVSVDDMIVCSAPDQSPTYFTYHGVYAIVRLAMKPWVIPVVIILMVSGAGLLVVTVSVCLAYIVKKYRRKYVTRNGYKQI